MENNEELKITDDKEVILDMNDDFFTGGNAESKTEEVEGKEEVIDKKDLTLDLEDLIKDEEIVETPTSDEDIDNLKKETLKLLFGEFKDDLFTEEELAEFDGSKESIKQLLATVIEAEAKALNDEENANVPELIKDLIKNYKENVPLNELINIKSEKIKYNTIKEEDINDDNSELSERIVRDFFNETTKFSKEKVDKEIKRLKDLGELAEEAKSALPELKKMQDIKENELIELTKKDKADRENRHKEQISKIKTTVQTTEEIIPGIKIPKNTKESIIKTLTEPVGLDDKGNYVSKMALARSKDPNYDIKVAYLFEITNGFSDFSKLLTKAETAITKKQDRILDSTKENKGSANTKNNLVDNLEALRQLYGKNKSNN